MWRRGRREHRELAAHQCAPHRQHLLVRPRRAGAGRAPAARAPDEAAACGSSFEARLFELARAANPDLRDFLRAANPAALLVDCFCSAALDVGAELRGGTLRRSSS